MRIILADDHDMPGDGLRAALESLGPAATVLKAAGLDEAHSLLAQAGGADIVVLTSGMEGETDGMRGIATLRQSWPDVRWVIVPALTDHQQVKQAIRLELIGRLTSRERDILGLLRDGLPNKVIASRLDLGEATIKSHLGNVYRKLGIRNRLQAMRLLVESERR